MNEVMNETVLNGYLARADEWEAQGAKYAAATVRDLVKEVHRLDHIVTALFQQRELQYPRAMKGVSMSAPIRCIYKDAGFDRDEEVQCPFEATKGEYCGAHSLAVDELIGEKRKR